MKMLELTPEQANAAQVLCGMQCSKTHCSEPAFAVVTLNDKPGATNGEDAVVIATCYGHLGDLLNHMNLTLFALDAMRTMPRPENN